MWQALRLLEQKDFAPSVFPGEGPGESIWKHVPLYVNERADCRSAYFTIRPATP